MKKQAWITALDKDEALARDQMESLSKYGVAVSGHFWINDLKKAAWSGALDTLLAPETSLWIISGKLATFATPDVRKGLSLLALKIQAEKGHGFHIMLRPTDGVLETDTLPTPLAGATILDKSDNLGLKAVAAVNLPAKQVWGDYRLGLMVMPSVGQWFEIGPRDGEWAGAMFGVAGAEIDAHGVGDAGSPPERCVLNYPMQNAKLEVGGVEYTAWAVQNPLDAGSSYYVRVKGAPEALVFGQMDAGDMPELYTIRLT